MTPKRVIGIGETVLDILFKDDQPQKAVFRPGENKKKAGTYVPAKYHCKVCVGGIISPDLQVPQAPAYNPRTQRYR